MASRFAFIRGIKIHPSFHLVSADNELYDNIWRYADEHGVILLSHTWDISLTNPVQKYSYPTRFEKFVKRYPGVRFILAHSGGRYNGILEAARIAKENRNVFLDIAGDIYANEFLEYITGEVGSQRILFGTDYPMMDQHTMLGVVLGAGISLKDKENILFNNAYDLFCLNGRCPL